MPIQQENDIVLETPEEFPKTLTALRAREKSHWAIGDALLEECGPPGRDSANNGSGEILTRAAEHFASKGVGCSVTLLRDCRKISYLYAPARRLAGVSWSVYKEVPNPEMLDRIFELEGQGVTSRRARELATAIREENRRIREAAREIERRRSRRRGGGIRRGRADSSRAAPTGTPDARNVVINRVPPVDQIPGIALSWTIQNKAGEAARLARQAKVIVDQRGGELPQVSIDAIVESALEAHQLWLDVANTVRGDRINQRSHLAVVGSVE